jgi:hypothetical protein
MPAIQLEDLRESRRFETLDRLVAARLEIEIAAIGAIEHSLVEVP